MSKFKQWLEEAKKKAEEEAKRKAEEEAKRKAEEERKKKEEMLLILDVQRLKRILQSLMSR